MGASFRNSGQILALAGCDLLTISPDLLADLENTQGTVNARLTADFARAHATPALALNESSFRFMMNEDAMAQDKLAEGIRVFVSDAKKLDTLLV